MELKKALELILAAWRRYDDENDLAAFELIMEVAIGLLEDLPSFTHADIIKSLFKEATENAESDHQGEHLHE